ncbi:hypothetical protein QEG98_13390 [Myxococcus sp. MxC21-1]|uniref:hypothetical protein n=1 Tax=Myxococcus sp. MxC21-1 TaxID=3041439 RepID=UPI00292D8F75|nr:hypothetical protein [Myxococcus sp. MxC21-1]WNZ64574.1 hypothetical protein QEG98_13390 [Myxococcus sp. MxC21-1]
MTVGLAHPSVFAADAQAPAEGDILIETSEGGWERFLTVEVFLRKNRVRSLVHWPLRKVGLTPSTVKLTAASPHALLYYVLSAEETAQLASGQYLIMAKLDTTQGASARSWKGMQDFAHVLWLTGKSDGMPANKDCGFVLSSYDYLDTIGRDQEALQRLDEFLPGAPSGTASACFAKRAALAEQAGELELAQELYCKADEDDFVATIALERSRKEGTQAPCFVSLPFAEDCRRLTEVVGTQPKDKSP